MKGDDLGSQRNEAPSRREFLGTAGALGAVAILSGGLTVGCKLFRKYKGSGVSSTPEDVPFNAWVNVSTAGTVSVVLDKAEMGQGATTLFAGLVAEELRMDPQAVNVVFAPVEEVYANKAVLVPVLGVDIPVHVMITALSSSTADAWKKIPQAAAQVRAQLAAVAAQEWGVSLAGVDVENGQVVETGGGKRSLPIAGLVTRAAKVPPQRAEPRVPSTWRVLGKDPRALAPAPGIPPQTRRVDADAKVTGRAIYGIDVNAQLMAVSELLHCALVRNPQVGGTVAALNVDAIKAMPGVVEVVPVLSGRAVAVVARRHTQARAGAAALQARFGDGPNAGLSSEGLVNRYLGMARGQVKGAGVPVHHAPFVLNKIRSSKKAIKREYVAPYVPHSTLEPMNAAAVVKDGVWHVWAPSQFPEAARSAVARTASVNERVVEVHQTQLGGGFGRRLLTDYVAEITAVCKAIGGRAVKMVWSREEDFQYDYFRPVAVHSIEAGVGGGNSGIQGWKHDVVSQSLNAFVTVDYVSAIVPDKLKNQKLLQLFARIGTKTLDRVGLDPFSVEGASESHYDIPAFHLTSIQPLPGEIPKLPVGYWRSVGHSHSAFAIESFLDEIGFEGGIDAIELRRAMLAKNPRARSVLDRVLEMSRYRTTPAGGGVALGVAAHSGWDSSAAMVAEVEVDKATWNVRVRRVWAAVDVGNCLQPDMVRAQIEGGIVFALSAALKQEITVERGVVQQVNFHQCDLVRMFECPAIEVHIEQHLDHEPTGVGELPVPPVAPAVANAIFRASGVRLRRMPFTPTRLAEVAKSK